jgi:hypothetical protein
MRLNVYAMGLLAVLAACDDDDGPGSSGVDPRTDVQDLTRAELEQFCEWTNSLYLDGDLSDEQLCTYKALEEAHDDEAKCEEKRLECLDKAEDGDRPDPIWRVRDCDNVDRDDIPRDCDVTVGEIEACVGDLHDWEWQYARFTSCEQWDDDSDWDDRPSSCDRVFDRCKDLWR